MDLLKAKIFLDKLNREFNRLNKDPENIARIDVDIMLAYARDFYDALLSERTASASPQRTSAPPPAPVPSPAPTPILPPAPESPPTPTHTLPPTPPPAPAPIAPPPPKPAPEPIVVTPRTAKSQSPTSEHPVGLDLLFEEKQVKEVADKLSELPIADLKKGIALNDRLLLTRELFADDAKAFDQTIQTLNQLNNFDEAKEYLIEHCVTRYAWPDKKRVETAKSFIKLVRRRFKTS